MLGRPLPLFDQVAAQLARQVAQRMQQSGHRPVHITLTQAAWSPLRQAAEHCTASVTRATALAFMAARYGFAGSSAALPEGSPPSSTELRITQGLQEAARQAVRDLLPEQSAHPKSAASTQLWQWQALIAIDAQAAQPISIQLDLAASQQFEALIHALRQEHTGSRPAPAKTSAPLQVQLVARLVEKTFSAADIQALRPGSVLPIPMGRATVLLNDCAMLNASVAEHQGKLHLTAFETLE